MAPFKLSHLSHKAMLEARVDFGGYLPLSRDQVSCLDSRGFIDKLESGNDSSPSLSSEHLSREDSATSPRSAPVAALRPNEQVVHPNGRAQYLAAEGEFLAQSAYWHRKMEELLQFPRPVLLIIDINNEDLHAVALDMFSVDRAACKKSAKETVTRLLPSEISCLRLFIMEHECSYVYSIYSIISYINERKITFSTKSCNEARVRAFRTDDEQKRLLGQQPIPKRRRL
ncbi:MAG: uncharacterized protein KVP18_000835 [Porospora cf. gigantea A]|uniref:uncharacterized protein n=1 Tax=Porospora cf. gigantea A TaxID=2853593 RepID=UPI003559A2B1|nr:MAG: hypothetical protein KVP18_000835 [Porospora cf. gigantea A]